MTVPITRRALATATALVAGLALTACGDPGDADDDTTPVRVGLIYSQSGDLAGDGKQYIEGFRAGLAHATGGTNKIGDRPVEITEVDDAGDAVQAVAAAEDLIGKGYRILAGSNANVAGLQIAPLAARDKVLFIAGTAKADALTGSNRYTFRSGRQLYQDVAAARSFLGDPAGKKVLVFGQDNSFGRFSVTMAETVMGSAGATVSSVLAPDSTTDFTPFASRIRAAKPDLLYVGFVSPTVLPAMWQTFDQQGVLTATTAVGSLESRASWSIFGAASPRISFLSHYYDGATDNEATKAAKAAVPGGTLEMYHPDGFTAAQMIVRAVREGGDDVEKMVDALEGWRFDGVKGPMTIRAEDHALLQPMFQARLAGSGDQLTVEPRQSLTGEQTAPPAIAMKG